MSGDGKSPDYEMSVDLWSDIIAMVSLFPHIPPLLQLGAVLRWSLHGTYVGPYYIFTCSVWACSGLFWSMGSRWNTRTQLTKVIPSSTKSDVSNL